MTDAARDRLDAFLHDGDQVIWSTAAVVVASQGGVSDEQRAAAQAVVQARGLDGIAGLSTQEAAGVAAQAAAPVHQVAALLHGQGQLWATQSDEALRAQGHASAQAAAAFATLGVPILAGLKEAFDGGARMLDVGTGVAAMAVAYAEVFPRLTVVGIDVLPRVLALAQQTVNESAVSDRVILREQDISALDEEDTYALVWLPAPFLPEPALRAGVVRTVVALRPGGWVMLGHGKYGGTAIDDAVGRFKTIAYGGTALDDEQAEDMLASAGLIEVRTIPTPHGAPAITLGRKPLTT
jgi:predicted O-methyltransferase YrrM